ncbi:MAG: hypothetical protein J6K76_02580 [Spirochaetaceae bacterium]|nr:hypothetical protein [Spirochaetaceae bacterium]MBQ7367866.1 hypothetical protein [Spirochaetaceae bacterium]
MERIELTAATMLKDVLQVAPQVRKGLETISPRFQMLNSPMGKIMMGKVTLGDMSQRSGVPLKELIEKIGRLMDTPSR